MSEAMITAARAEGHPVGLKFEAAWCKDCVELTTALETTTLEGLTVLSLDADDVVHVAPLLAKFAILELPTFVWLDPDGTERGRVVGFFDRVSWRRELDAVREGARTLEALTPAEDALAHAEALLSRDPAAGTRALETLARGDDGEAAEALHRLGRYHQRAQQNPEAARPVWRDLFLRFEDHPRALGALVWHARAHAATGHPEQGSDAFKVRHDARPRDADLVLAWASFAAEEALESRRSAVQEAAMKALGTARGADRDRLEDLVMQLGVPFDRKPAS